MAVMAALRGVIFIIILNKIEEKEGHYIEIIVVKGRYFLIYLRHLAAMLFAKQAAKLKRTP